MSDDETSVPAVRNIDELGKLSVTFIDQGTNMLLIEAEATELEIAVETQSTGWKVNQSSTTVEDPSILGLHLTNPPVKRIDLLFPRGMELQARNERGVTIMDALDAIYKVYKKSSDEDLEEPYLVGFGWDKEDCWTRLVVRLTSDPA